jgi:hypothetical protein
MQQGKVLFDRLSELSGLEICCSGMLKPVLARLLTVAPTRLEII